jgi:glycosyltransferase involved in cell wall biosynthesis
MHDFSKIRKDFEALRCCVIIPTYNNDRTLKTVIDDVRNYTDSIIIVNDGSTDSTSRILSHYHNYHVINIPVNRGKGNALQAGFRYAIEKEFRYAITIDSDGQHFPADLPAFIEWIARDPDSLIVGARNMEQEGVPGTSNFGHKFSIFWYRVETGIRIPDVQSGYRLYPLDRIRDMKFYTSKYEFEVEILVRAAWRGVPILSMPVNVYYAPPEERVSHFRKFRDFARVSAVNTILVFMALLWVRPVQIFRELRKKSFRQIIRDHVFNSSDSNVRLALSVAAGFFIGVSPIWGWQIVIAFGAAQLLKLNKFVTVAAANISIPPMIPLILFASLFMGKLMLGAGTAGLAYNPGISFQWIKMNLIQYLAGSVFLGACLAITGGTATYILLRIFRKKQPETVINESGSR